ncbi:hypothetical protein NC651_019094 [Populus alba x Populus x berolinensis]|nr:hypothetical protein NC651_019094 [Populus alba x Populus x berolinensis]
MARPPKPDRFHEPIPSGTHLRHQFGLFTSPSNTTSVDSLISPPSSNLFSQTLSHFPSTYVSGRFNTDLPMASSTSPANVQDDMRIFHPCHYRPLDPEKLYPLYFCETSNSKRPPHNASAGDVLSEGSTLLGNLAGRHGQWVVHSRFPMYDNDFGGGTRASRRVRSGKAKQLRMVREISAFPGQGNNVGGDTCFERLLPRVTGTRKDVSLL